MRCNLLKLLVRLIEHTAFLTRSIYETRAPSLIVVLTDSLELGSLPSLWATTLRSFVVFAVDAAE